MPYTFITDGDKTIIESADKMMLKFVYLVMRNGLLQTGDKLEIPTNEKDKAKQYIALWYETQAEAQNVETSQGKRQVSLAIVWYNGSIRPHQTIAEDYKILNRDFIKSLKNQNYSGLSRLTY